MEVGKVESEVDAASLPEVCVRPTPFFILPSFSVFRTPYSTPSLDISSYQASLISLFSYRLTTPYFATASMSVRLFLFLWWCDTKCSTVFRAS